METVDNQSVPTGQPKRQNLIDNDQSSTAGFIIDSQSSSDNSNSE
jgi:hypothetical protein